jgi:hypothetical protein
VSNVAEANLDALLTPPPSDEAVLNALLNPDQEPASPGKPVAQGKKPSAQEAHDERLEASKGALKRENAALAEDRDKWKGRAERSHKVVMGALIFGAVMATLAAGMYLWARASVPRAMETAFRIISYREDRALSANALVLDEWDKKIKALLAKVAEDQNIAPDEREKRIRTLNALMTQLETTESGFMRQLSENEKESSVSGGFSYRDPYLKREINFADEMGGKVDLDAIRDEVRKNANVDESMKSLEAMMTSPVPMEEQVRQEAVLQKQQGTLKSIDLTKGIPGAGNVNNLPTGPNPNTSQVEVQ